jgi:transposase InsO family protein
VAYFARLGITGCRVMSDKGPCFNADRFAQTRRELQLKLIRTRFYSPGTNGKAERVIRTVIREWAYAPLSLLCGSPFLIASLRSSLQLTSSSRRLRPRTTSLPFQSRC